MQGGMTKSRYSTNISLYIKDGTTYGHSCNEILTGSYALLGGMTSPGDLAIYLMTRSIARSLCDSWASCEYFLAYWLNRLMALAVGIMAVASWVVYCCLDCVQPSQARKHSRPIIVCSHFLATM